MLLRLILSYCPNSISPVDQAVFFIPRLRITYLLHGPESFMRSFSASQEIPRILWNPMVHYRVYKCPVSSRSQIKLVGWNVGSPSHFLKIHLKITFPCTPGSSKWSLSHRFPHQNPVHNSAANPHTSYMPSPPHFSRFDHSHNTG